MTTSVPDWLSPGNFDPEMAYLLSKTTFDAAGAIKSPTAFKKELQFRSTRFFHQARKMAPRGQRIPWYDLDFGRTGNTSALTLSGSIDNGNEAATARRRKRT